MRNLNKIIIPSILFILTIVIINVSANTSSKVTTENLRNVSSTLLDSNLFTQADDKREYKQTNVEMKNFSKVLENDNLALFVDDTAFAIRIENKTTGFIWASDYLLGSLTNTFKNRSRSAFLISYIDTSSDNFHNQDKHLLEYKEVNLDKQIDEANQSVTFFVDIIDIKIRLSYSIKLLDSTIEVAMNKEAIVEYGTNMLTKISFFEFLGSAFKNSIPGYNFIPSGSGALVRYGATSNITDIYKSRFLGKDLYHMIEENEQGLNYPIYGSVHGIDQNGFLVNIKNGAEYAEYNYTPTGKFTSFHRQNTTFYIRDTIIMTIKGNSKTITRYIKNNFDIKFDISFLSNDEANYVGMAKKYKEYLISNGKLSKINDSSDGLKLHLDVLGSDYEEGIFFNKTLKMTTVSDILNINEELTENGVNNIFYTLRGFNNGGYTKSNYKNYTFSRSLGNYRDLKDLDVAYYYNPIVRYQTKEGAPKHTLQTVYNSFAREIIPNGNYYLYYTDIEEVNKHFNKAYDKISNYGGMALDGLSNSFYSNKKLTRTQTYDIYDNLLSEKIAMFNPNYIMLDSTSKFLNMQLQHDRLRFLSDTVPFLQIVLSGYVPYYSTYLNFSANMNIDVLKVIDFGANPAYLVTKQPSHLLANSLSREYYGSYYGNLNSYIIDNYKYINDALKNVIGYEIIAREVIQGTDDNNVIIDGLVATKYKNDTTIFVNYSNSDYVYNGNTIKAMDYFVLGS